MLGNYSKVAIGDLGYNTTWIDFPQTESNKYETTIDYKISCNFDFIPQKAMLMLWGVEVRRVSDSNIRFPGHYKYPGYLNQSGFVYIDSFKLNELAFQEFYNGFTVNFKIKSFDKEGITLTISHNGDAKAIKGLLIHNIYYVAIG